MSDVLVIAEAGVNHNGSLSRAIEMVDAAAEAGAQCIKFQAFQPKSLVAKGTGAARYQSQNTGSDSQLDLISDLALTINEFAQIAERCQSQRIEFLATIFELSFLKPLLALGMRRIKVASGELTNHPALQHFAKLNLPIYLSTGMATDDEVDNAVSVLRSSGASDITLLQCTSLYPAPPELTNLLAMPAMGHRNALPYGYSDHTLGTHIAIAATALGACVIEKHFTLDQHLPGPDHKASLEPAELARMIAEVKEASLALGTPWKQPGPEELETAELVRRSWHAARDLEAGSLLSDDDVVLKRPASGAPPACNVIGRTLKNPVGADRPISRSDLI